LLYYRVFRPMMAAEDTARMEEFRVSMGHFGRLLMGGIAEEVMFRWGVMSVMAWLTVSVLGMPTGLGMWTAIVAAGVLFGLGHLPGVMAAGVKITKLIVVTAIALNMVVALACGWLLWQHGLLAAIVAHALLHAIWHPLERTRRSRG
jgi:membrane protease YdiL (CAAX protease family)